MAQNNNPSPVQGSGDGPVKTKAELLKASQVEAEEKRKAEAEAKLKADAEAKLKADAEAKLKADAEAKLEKTYYRLKSGVSSVFISGQHYTKKDNAKFAEDANVLAKYRSGYLEKID